MNKILTVVATGNTTASSTRSAGTRVLLETGVGNAARSARYWASSILTFTEDRGGAESAQGEDQSGDGELHFVLWEW